MTLHQNWACGECLHCTVIPIDEFYCLQGPQFKSKYVYMSKIVISVERDNSRHF